MTMVHVHGGNVYQMAARLGCTPEDLLDFSASINPLGPPAGLGDELVRQFGRLCHYPDIGNSRLIETLARFHGIDDSRIAVGNGSTELIYWLPYLLGVRSVLVVLPTFSEYQKAFALAGVRLNKLYTRPENHFQPTVEELAACCQRDSPEAILLTHPGSPAGAPLPREVRQWLLNRSRDQGTVFVVDEVFVDFCEEESLKHSLADVERLVLIRSLTKFYALPGLRLGYLFTWEALAARLRERLPPWSVNTFAQIGGVYGLEQQGYQAETLRLIERERRNLSESLARTRAFRVHPGCANYVLFELDNNLPSAQVLRDDLVAAHGILIRDCSSFEGLGPHYARVAVRLPEENGRLLNALHSWLGRHGH